MVAFFCTKFIFHINSTLHMGISEDSDTPFLPWVQDRCDEQAAAIRELGAKCEKLTEKLESVTSERDTLAKENEKLKAKLRIYENPNTPSSAKPFKENAKKDRKGRRGAPQGHDGTTRETPEPDETIDVHREECPGCQADLGDPIGVKVAVREDIIPERRRVYQYNLYTYRCPVCGKEVVSRHKNCPKEGRFGTNVILAALMFKFISRAPARRNAELLESVCGLRVSPATVLSLISRAAQACCTERDAIIERIRCAKWVHIDETGMRVDGKNWWVWVFRTDANDVLVVIENTRSGAVPKRILKKRPPPVVTDGWGGYNWISTRQRCWAHMLRVVEEVKGASPAGAGLNEAVHALYHDLKRALALEDIAERRDAKAALEARLRDIITAYDEDDEELKRPLKHIRNGIGDWFTCLDYPGMPATNNLAEQAVREHVIQRKIIGAFRSEDGPADYACISTLLDTWKYQGKDPFAEMQRVLERELCLKD